MSVKKITGEVFEEEVLNAKGKVLVDFYADWCMPCKMMGTILEQVAEEVGEKAKICKINIDDEKRLAVKYEIMSIPNLIIFENGEIKERFVGLMQKEDLVKALL